MDFNDAVIGLVVVGILGLLAGAWSWAVVTAGKLGVEDAYVAWGGHPPGAAPATRSERELAATARPVAPAPTESVAHATARTSPCSRPLVTSGDAGAHAGRPQAPHR